MERKAARAGEKVNLHTTCIYLLTQIPAQFCLTRALGLTSKDLPSLSGFLGVVSQAPKGPQITVFSPVQFSKSNSPDR